MDMKRRISIWALCGFTVASAWVVAGFLAGPSYNFSRSTIVAITAPASLLGRNMPMTLYMFILLNAVIYAIVGFGAEVFRKQLTGPLAPRVK
jgi:hypothetical protein